MLEKIRIGVSRTLLGESVRFDGGHARDRYVTDTLGQYMESMPVCPDLPLTPSHGAQTSKPCLNYKMEILRLPW